MGKHMALVIMQGCLCEEYHEDNTPFTNEDFRYNWGLPGEHVLGCFDTCGEVWRQKQPRTLKKVLGCASSPGLFGV